MSKQITIYTILCNKIEKRIFSSININTESKSFRFSYDYFKNCVTYTMEFSSYDNKNIESVDDIDFITLKHEYTNSNENDIKNKMKEKTNYVISKRTEEMNALKKERDELNTKLDQLDHNDSIQEIKNLYKEIELLSDKIRNHNKEIIDIKKNLKEVEISNETSVYELKLYRNGIKHICGLPEQHTNFSLLWFSEKDENKIIEPISTELKNTKKITLDYNTLCAA